MSYQDKKKFPQLLIATKTPAFAAQIAQVIKNNVSLVIETKILYDQYNAPSDTNILITDNVEFVNIKCTYLIFIGDTLEEIEQAGTHIENITNRRETQLYIFQKKDLSKENLAAEIKNAASNIMFKSSECSNTNELSAALDQKIELLEAYEKALDLASAVQKYVMTNGLSNLKNFIYSYDYEAFQKVSGDFFLVKEAYGKLFIMIGDVTDHGYAAGLYGAAIYAFAISYIENTSIRDLSVINWTRFIADSALTYHPIDQEAADLYNQSLTATATFAILDIKTGKLQITMCGSGMEPPMFIKKGEAIQSKTPNTPLPPLGEWNFTGDLVNQDSVVTIKLYKGDTMIFYSDGLTEVFVDNNIAKDAARTFSSERLFESAKKAAEAGVRDPKKIQDQIIRDSAGFSISPSLEYSAEKPEITDDFTIMVLQWKKEENEGDQNESEK